MTKEKLAIYYDAEFTGLHKNTTLISIGFVSTTESTFYAEFTDYDKDQVDEWIEKNVIPDLYLDQGKEKSFVNGVSKVKIKGDSSYIKKELLKWLENECRNTGKQIQIFTDCYAYDWVLLMDLICENGKAINIPEYIYYIPIDLSTALFNIGIDPDISREEFVGYLDAGETYVLKHNSLWDASIIKKCFDKYNDILLDEEETLESVTNSYKSIQNKIRKLIDDVFNKYKYTPYTENTVDSIYVDLENTFAKEYPNCGRNREINKSPFPDIILCSILEDKGFNINDIDDFKYVDTKFVMDKHGCLNIEILSEMSENYKEPRDPRDVYFELIRS